MSKLQEIKTMDDLGEELCEYCEISESTKGVQCYRGEPIFCFEDVRKCNYAYQNYLNNQEAE